MIKHIKCDIFESGADVICHQVNCQGVMGSCVAKQVRERYPEVYEKYKMDCDFQRGRLGKIQVVAVNQSQSIINLFAQDNYGYDGKCYTDYRALEECLKRVRAFCSERHQTIAFPYLMSCARGGGDWNIAYKMIEDIFKDYDEDILICEYDGEK